MGSTCGTAKEDTISLNVVTGTKTTNSAVFAKVWWYDDESINCNVFQTSSATSNSGWFQLTTGCLNKAESTTITEIPNLTDAGDRNCVFEVQLGICDGGTDDISIESMLIQAMHWKYDFATSGSGSCTGHNAGWINNDWDPFAVLNSNCEKASWDVYGVETGAQWRSGTNNWSATEYCPSPSIVEFEKEIEWYLVGMIGIILTLLLVLIINVCRFVIRKRKQKYSKLNQKDTEPETDYL